MDNEQENRKEVHKNIYNRAESNENAVKHMGLSKKNLSLFTYENTNPRVVNGETLFKRENTKKKVIEEKQK